MMKLKTLLFFFALVALTACTSGPKEYLFFDDSSNPGVHSGFDDSGNVNWVVLTPEEQRATNFSLIDSSVISVRGNFLPILGNPGFSFTTKNNDPYPDPTSIYIAAYRQVNDKSKNLILWTFAFNSSEDADAVREGFSKPANEDDLFRVLRGGNTFIEVSNGFSKTEPALIDAITNMLSQRLDMPLLDNGTGQAP